MGSSKATPTKATPVKSGIESHFREQSPSPFESPAKRQRHDSTPRERVYTHVPPGAAQKSQNGRQVGRSLITWTRPRMAEKLLLHIQYECTRTGVNIPWELVAHRLHPGSAAGAILQHLNRVRHQLVAEGHLVPPIALKPGANVDVNRNIRGYIRKFPNPEDNDVTTTRAVEFDEDCDDRKHNLPDAYDNSGTPRVKRGQMGGKDRATSSTPRKLVNTTPSKAKAGGSAVKIKKEASPDPADLDSEEDYQPGQTAGNRRNRRPTRAAATKTKKYAEDEGSEAVEEEDVEANTSSEAVEVANLEYQQPVLPPHLPGNNNSFTLSHRSSPMPSLQIGHNGMAHIAMPQQPGQHMSQHMSQGHLPAYMPQPQPSYVQGQDEIHNNIFGSQHSNSFQSDMHDDVLAGDYEDEGHMYANQQALAGADEAAYAEHASQWTHHA